MKNSTNIFTKLSKKITFFSFFIFFFSSIVFSQFFAGGVGVVSAVGNEDRIIDIQKEYTPLAGEIPFITSSDGNAASLKSKTLEEFIANVYTFTVTISIVAAVIMLIYHGFTYATSAVIPVKSNAKNGIKNVFLGLLLVLGAYIILNTISPRLVIINFSSLDTTGDIKDPAGGASTGNTPPVSNGAGANPAGNSANGAASAPGGNNPPNIIKPQVGGQTKTPN